MHTVKSMYNFDEAKLELLTRLAKRDKADTVAVQKAALKGFKDPYWESARKFVMEQLICPYMTLTVSQRNFCSGISEALDKELLLNDPKQNAGAENRMGVEERILESRIKEARARRKPAWTKESA